MKNLLSAQSKYGLLGSSAKTKNFYSRVPIISMLSPSSPHHPHMVPIPPGLWSPCYLHGLHPTWSPHPHGLCGPQVIPIIPTSSPRHPHIIPTSSPHHLEGPYIIPTPLWCGRPRISINSIRFGLIEIFQFCLKI